MNASQIQAMIALNAARITGLHIDIEDTQEDASFHFATGEVAFGIDAARSIKHMRTKLGKAVKLQNEMKAELKGIQRNVRIVSKTAKLSAVGIYAGSRVGKTSMEVEADLDEVLALLPKKPDSRIAA